MIPLEKEEISGFGSFVVCVVFVAFYPTLQSQLNQLEMVEVSGFVCVTDCLSHTG
jgi:hypothetical protein